MDAVESVGNGMSTTSVPIAFHSGIPYQRSKSLGKLIKTGSKLTDQQRKDIVSFALWGVRNSREIHYAEIRPVPLKKTVRTQAQELLPLTTDCSGFATFCYYHAKAPDPNGQNYDTTKLMYTGTMLQNMIHIPWIKRKPGDLVVFGNPPGHHVCIYIEEKSVGDCLLVSHGGEAGPLLIRMSVERKYQPTPRTWLTL